MTDVDATGTTAPTDDTAPAAPENTIATDDSLEAPPDGQAPEQDEFEDVEYEGKTYKVPKPLKSGILMQRDYTQKTQALAEERRQHEAEKQSHAERAKAFEANRQDYARLSAFDIELARYKNVDWTRFSAEDPTNAQAAFMRYSQLRDGREGLARELTEREQKSAFDEKQSTAKQLEQANTVLARDIPNWNPETRAKLRDFASSTYGYGADELDTVADARAIKVLHDAWLGRQLIAKQRASERKPAPPAEPIKSVGRGGSAPPQGLADNLGTAEWMKRRNAQISRR